jgi:hypothetical protein
MSDDELVLLEEATGPAQAETLRGLLEAQGIQILISQESAGQSALPVTFGILGGVQLLVKKKDLEQARQILDEYYAGDFIEQSDDENAAGEPPEGSGDEEGG